MDDGCHGDEDILKEEKTQPNFYMCLQVGSAFIRQCTNRCYDVFYPLPPPSPHLNFHIIFNEKSFSHHSLQLLGNVEAKLLKSLTHSSHHAYSHLEKCKQSFIMAHTNFFCVNINSRGSKQAGRSNNNNKKLEINLSQTKNKPMSNEWNELRTLGFFACLPQYD